MAEIKVLGMLHCYLEFHIFFQIILGSWKNLKATVTQAPVFLSSFQLEVNLIFYMPQDHGPQSITLFSAQDDNFSDTSLYFMGSPDYVRPS
jgi:hypothetical protein